MVKPVVWNQPLVGGEDAGVKTSALSSGVDQRRRAADAEHAGRGVEAAAADRTEQRARQGIGQGDCDGIGRVCAVIGDLDGGEWCGGCARGHALIGHQVGDLRRGSQWCLAIDRGPAAVAYRCPGNAGVAPTAESQRCDLRSAVGGDGQEIRAGAGAVADDRVIAAVVEVGQVDLVIEAGEPRDRRRDSVVVADLQRRVGAGAGREGDGLEAAEAEAAIVGGHEVAWGALQFQRIAAAAGADGTGDGIARLQHQQVARAAEVDGVGATVDRAGVDDRPAAAHRDRDGPAADAAIICDGPAARLDAGRLPVDRRTGIGGAAVDDRAAGSEVHADAIAAAGQDGGVVVDGGGVVFGVDADRAVDQGGRCAAGAVGDAAATAQDDPEILGRARAVARDRPGVGDAGGAADIDAVIALDQRRGAVVADGAVAGDGDGSISDRGGGEHRAGVGDRARLAADGDGTLIAFDQRSGANVGDRAVAPDGDAGIPAAAWRGDGAGVADIAVQRDRYAAIALDQRGGANVGDRAVALDLDAVAADLPGRDDAGVVGDLDDGGGAKADDTIQIALDQCVGGAARAVDERASAAEVDGLVLDADNGAVVDDGAGRCAAEGHAVRALERRGAGTRHGLAVGDGAAVGQVGRVAVGGAGGDAAKIGQHVAGAGQLHPQEPADQPASGVADAARSVQVDDVARDAGDRAAVADTAGAGQRYRAVAVAALGHRPLIDQDAGAGDGISWSAVADVTALCDGERRGVIPGAHGHAIGNGHAIVDRRADR